MIYVILVTLVILIIAGLLIAFYAWANNEKDIAWVGYAVACGSIGALILTILT